MARGQVVQEKTPTVQVCITSAKFNGTGTHYVIGGTVDGRRHDIEVPAGVVGEGGFQACCEALRNHDRALCRRSNPELLGTCELEWVE